jgi:hypothetical protein
MRALLGKGRENGKVVGHVVSYTSPQPRAGQAAISRKSNGPSFHFATFLPTDDAIND